MTDPRHTGAYVMARRAFIRSSANGTPCSLCGRAIDTTLSGNAPWGPTIEHTVPVRHAPELALDTTLWRLAHRRCNNRQGGAASRDWTGGRPGSGFVSRW